MKAFLLEPYIASAVWGGRRLIEDWGMNTQKPNAAEAWVLSCHAAGQSLAQGVPLGRLLSEHPEYLGALAADEFPILVKLIDARDDLSVQVHPTAEYCAATGKGQPKTECWLILDCEPGARLAMGFNQDVTREQVRAALEDDSIMELVNFVPVKRGDFFFIPAGTLHAIGKGILLAEVQQSSDTTYRLYDYNRPGMDGKPRPLHVEEALGCLDFEKQPPRESEQSDYGVLCACPEFRVERLRVEDGGELEDDDSFRVLLVLSGVGELHQGGDVLALGKGDCVFLPANSGAFRLSGELELLLVSP
ncbi:MAG: class I mannose-6-phosphate isomerase [Clostridium sp.]|nr:class I mannose-6-phosphate isomerase [Clostridium sp.]